eukprot:6209763-Pleurochrysis_carterae.AAC.6
MPYAVDEVQLAEFDEARPVFEVFATTPLCWSAVRKPRPPACSIPSSFPIVTAFVNPAAAADAVAVAAAAVAVAATAAACCPSVADTETPTFASWKS